LLPSLLSISPPPQPALLWIQTPVLVLSKWVVQVEEPVLSTAHICYWKACGPSTPGNGWALHTPMVHYLTCISVTMDTWLQNGDIYKRWPFRVSWILNVLIGLVPFPCFLLKVHACTFLPQVYLMYPTIVA
jgi:hypothetical protein